MRSSSEIVSFLSKNYLWKYIAKSVCVAEAVFWYTAENSHHLEA
jgi:hypothetical protein